MVGEGPASAEEALGRVNRICKFISIAMKIVFIVLSVCWLFAAAVMIVSQVDPGFFGSVDSMSPVAIVLYFVYAVIVAVGFVTLIRIFSDVAKGYSPFTMVQVGRLRLISGMLVLYGFFDFVITSNASLLQLGGMDSGYISTNEGAIVAFNFAPLIAAAVVFAFSFVFKYGVLLQEFSDDTL